MLFELRKIRTRIISTCQLYQHCIVKGLKLFFQFIFRFVIIFSIIIIFTTVTNNVHPTFLYLTPNNIHIINNQITFRLHLENIENIVSAAVKAFLPTPINEILPERTGRAPNEDSGEVPGLDPEFFLHAKQPQELHFHRVGLAGVGHEEFAKQSAAGVDGNVRHDQEP